MPALKEQAQSVASLSSSDSGSLTLSIISSLEDNDINRQDSKNSSNDKFRAQRVDHPVKLEI